MYRNNIFVTTCLFRIISESAWHLIWRLIRSKRVIQEKNAASNNEIHNRWLRGINNRLRIDCALTNEMKYGKKFLKKDVVLNTWCKVLKEEDKLPQYWTGVSMGIG
ncbi:hypothetical protein C8R43DRAFT_887574 [Mycena crocata]|nr:hypothetical protein C8R43DRAFT_887574 [Mycena crocata]